MVALLLSWQDKNNFPHSIFFTFYFYLKTTTITVVTLKIRFLLNKTKPNNKYGMSKIHFTLGFLNILVLQKLVDQLCMTYLRLEIAESRMASTSSYLIRNMI